MSVMNGGQLAVGADPEHVGVGLLGRRLETFPVAEDAEWRIGEPDRVVRLHHDVVRRIETLALETVGEHGDLAVLLGARDAARHRVLAGDEASLPVAGVAVGEIGRAAEHRDAAVLFVVLHDPVVGDVAPQQISAIREIGGPFRPAHAAGDLLHRAAVDAVFQEARVENFERRLRIALVRPERKGLRHRLAACGRCRQRTGAGENVST